MSKVNLSSCVSCALRWGAALMLSGGVNIAAAQAETVELGNGASVTIEEYLIETDPNGHKTLVVRTVPNFDPEPFGKVPSDDYARQVRPLCTNLVNHSAAAIDENDIDTVRVRWDFPPSKSDDDLPENMTLTRFHEMVFDITDDAPCLPKPLGVGLNNLTPELSGGIVATLRWAEPGLTPGELSLTYAVDSGLADISVSALDRTALELCILHADLLLETRARYYSQLESRTVAITLEQEQEKPGFELLRRVKFPVRDGKCATGLSEMLTDAIRAKAIRFAENPSDSN
ncbi:hypothetical protein ACK6D9_06660 [Hoeflea sp. Naph1]|uniref:hypothetical protein n=1 Tax=Hoeflea sp. Naph1 TaxID=3388653 RepID=UPI00398FBCC7